jgi:hypothetical protein
VGRRGMRRGGGVSGRDATSSPEASNRWNRDRGAPPRRVRLIKRPRLLEFVTRVPMERLHPTSRYAPPAVIVPAAPFLVLHART